MNLRGGFLNKMRKKFKGFVLESLVVALLFSFSFLTQKEGFGFGFVKF